MGDLYSLIKIATQANVSKTPGMQMNNEKLNSAHLYIGTFDLLFVR